MHLHDILKKLSAKTYFDASFMCFLDLLHFVSLLTVYVVERKFVVCLTESNLKPPRGVGWKQWKHWRIEAMATGR